MVRTINLKLKLLNEKFKKRQAAKAKKHNFSNRSFNQKRMKINIPGLHNSNEAHWQSYFERLEPHEFIRVEQKNWDQPDCATWIAQIEETLESLNHKDLILIGHSIGCIAIVKWFEEYGHSVKGVLLVAPSDSEKENYPNYIKGFTPIPKNQLPFPSIVVASDNDHVTDLKRSKEFASNWGSQLIILKKAGHIEPKSGFSQWNFGRELLKRLENS